MRQKEWICVCVFVRDSKNTCIFTFAPPVSIVLFLIALFFIRKHTVLSIPYVTNGREMVKTSENGMTKMWSFTGRKIHTVLVTSVENYHIFSGIYALRYDVMRERCGARNALWRLILRCAAALCGGAKVHCSAKNTAPNVPHCRSRCSVVHNYVVWLKAFTWSIDGWPSSQDR